MGPRELYTKAPIFLEARHFRALERDFDPIRELEYDQIRQLEKARYIVEVERVEDPDSEISSLCCACRQPIFLTPSISFSRSSGKLFLHEQCVSLPPKHLHELHPHQPLVLVNQLLPPLQPDTTSYTCHNCNEACGTSFYHCPNPSCDFRLDLLCVLQLKIKHKSHNHALTVIRQRESSSSLTCSACNTKHHWDKSKKLSLSYLCSLCGYWIHPDCALLLNALNYEFHKRTLFLIYHLPPTILSYCFWCDDIYEESFGAFVCLKCTDYLVHAGCALRNPQFFKPGSRNVQSKNLEREEDEEVVKRRTDKMKMFSKQ